jgi:hypothetical protein
MEPVTLLHWQVETDGSFLCNRDSLLAKAPKISGIWGSTRATTSSTVVWGTHTLTSPTVYAHYASVQAENGCGGSYKDIAIPIEDLSTFDKEGATAVDFRHLAYSTVGPMSFPLVPLSSYCGDWRQRLLSNSKDDRCKEVYHDYRPKLAFRIAPSVLASIDPAWKYCRNQQFCPLDPPIALNTLINEDPGSSLEHQGYITLGNTGATVPSTATRTGAVPIMISTPLFEPGNEFRVAQPVLPPQITVSIINQITYRVSEPMTERMYHRLDRGSGTEDGPHLNIASTNANSGKTGISPLGGLDTVEFTVSGQKHTATREGNEFVIGKSTIKVGAGPITINGAIISALPGGDGIVVGDKQGRSLADGQAWEDSTNLSEADRSQSKSATAASLATKGKKNDAREMVTYRTLSVHLAVIVVLYLLT